MTKAQEAHAAAANRHRKDINIAVGDEVWLSSKNLSTDRPSKKLDYKKLGPFPVTFVRGTAVTLDLPASMSVNPTFHTSLLSRDPQDPLPDQHLAPPPPVNVQDHDEYEVDEILATRYFGKGKRLQYRVKWRGYPPDLQWYNADGDEFAGCEDLITDFYEQYPDAAGSPHVSTKGATLRKTRGRV